jgi:hypothetical protein
VSASKVRRTALAPVSAPRELVVCPNCHHLSYGLNRKLISLSTRLRLIKYRWLCCRSVQTIDRLTGEETWVMS